MLAREGIASLPAMVLLRPDRDPLTGLNAADLKKTVAEALAATPARHSDSFPVRDETSATLRPLAGRCFSAAFSPDGKTLAVAGGWDNPPEPGEVTLWNLGSRRPVWMRRQDEACRAVLFSPDGRHLAVGDFGGRVRLLDPATGRVQRELPGHEDLVNSLAFSADGRLLASGGFDDMAQVVEAATGAVRQKWSLTDHILCGARSPDGRRRAAATWQGRLFVWDVSDGSKRWESTGCRNLPDAGVEVVRFAPDGKTLFTGSRDRSLVQWRARDGKLLREFKGHVKGIQNIQFSPDGRLMASSDASGAVRLWDLVGGSPRGRWQAHPERCFGLAFSPGGGRVATASWDYTAKVWDTATFLPLAVLDRKTVTLP
jgi:WD40 repeat protein